MDPCFSLIVENAEFSSLADSGRATSGYFRNSPDSSLFRRAAQVCDGYAIYEWPGAKWSSQAVRIQHVARIPSRAHKEARRVRNTIPQSPVQTTGPQKRKPYHAVLESRAYSGDEGLWIWLRRVSGCGPRNSGLSPNRGQISKSCPRGHLG